MMRQLPCILGVIAVLGPPGLRRVGVRTATVHGKVTQADGTPLPGGRIDFRRRRREAWFPARSRRMAPTRPLRSPTVITKSRSTTASCKASVPRRRAFAPMPGSDQKYVPINPNYAKPETSG